MHEFDEIVSIDSLQACLFHFMTQYTHSNCPYIAKKVVETLNQLCKHPNIDLLPEQKEIYSKMLNFWRIRCPVISEYSFGIH